MKYSLQIEKDNCFALLTAYTPARTIVVEDPVFFNP